ncbi:MAG TPA: N-acyl homoserine lactonase family protein [Acetobacteraceae bacterium]|nr:N-acyl homoserine lactonase family protein [Acetobacteraceae bacterium]
MNAAAQAEYEIYAIRYAHDANRRLAENFLPPLAEPVDLHDAPMPLDFFVWLIRGNGRTILVDTGFDAQEAARRGRTVMTPVEDGLSALGVQPDAVEDVVLTHLHWDHAGNHDLFARARYHVQDREAAFCTGRCMCHAWMRRPYAVHDVTAFVHKLYAGRVQFHDGTDAIAPGVTVHWTGGHSRGLQVVRVRTRRGWVVLASDASHYYANLDQSRPFPLLTDTEEMLNGFKLVRELASSDQHYIPGHDPLVLTRYPALRADAPHIVRVDVEPRPD